MDAGDALAELEEYDDANIARSTLVKALQLASNILDDDFHGLMEANA